jgi:hypothetical protein
MPHQFHIQIDDSDLVADDPKSFAVPMRTPYSVRKAMSNLSETGKTKVAEAAGSFRDVAEVTKAALTRAVDPVITAGKDTMS